MHGNIPLNQEFANLDLGILPPQPLHVNSNMHSLQKRFLRKIYKKKERGIERAMAHCEMCKERWIDTEHALRKTRLRKKQCKNCCKAANDPLKNNIRTLSSDNDMDPWIWQDHLLLPKLNFKKRMTNKEEITQPERAISVVMVHLVELV